MTEPPAAEEEMPADLLRDFVAAVRRLDRSGKNPLPELARRFDRTEQTVAAWIFRARSDGLLDDDRINPPWR